jgi:wyosine [tRNA(Phe)-imidazoG37] synthetase (radical SAM superfamily)
MQTPAPDGHLLFAAHARGFAANRYVYPVISRRAGGLSIGVNLNGDAFCNFRCVYCQVDRAAARETVAAVDLKILADELDRMVEQVVSGAIYQGPQFRHTPEPLRRFNDIAISGDGEPTACAEFGGAVDVCAEVRRRRRLDDVKLVLITNASLLHQPRVREALRVLDANGGEIWAKLDAGTEDYYRRVDRSAVPWQRILNNLREAAQTRPIVIQSLLLRMHDQPPPAAEVEAYCRRLEEIVAAGGRIKLVQVHTIARQPTEPWVAALTDAEVDALAAEVRCRTGLPAAAFYGGRA